MKTSRGVHSLAERRPDIAKDWDYDRNELTPDDVAYGARKKAYWVCQKCGHRWQSIINSRTSKQGLTGCLKCSKENRIRKFKESMQARALLKKTFNCELTKYVAKIPCETLKCPVCGHCWDINPEGIEPYTEIKCICSEK